MAVYLMGVEEMACRSVVDVDTASTSKTVCDGTRGRRRSGGAACSSARSGLRKHIIEAEQIGGDRGGGGQERKVKEKREGSAVTRGRRTSHLSAG